VQSRKNRPHARARVTCARAHVTRARAFSSCTSDLSSTHLRMNSKSPKRGMINMSRSDWMMLGTAVLILWIACVIVVPYL
jgi:hypothetical protein